MTTSQRVIKNTLFLYIRTIVSLLVSVFTTRILLDALGESDYGLYNVVGGSIAMLGFLSASMSGATQRYLSFAEGAGKKGMIVKYLSNSIVIHYGLALLMVVVYLLGALFFFNGILNIPEGKNVTALIVYGCMLLSAVFSVTIVPYDAEINAHEDMLFYSILGIGDVLAKFVIVVAVYFFHSDQLVLYAVLMALESFLLRMITKFYCKRKYEECKFVNLQEHFDVNTIKEMATFAGWNLVNIGTGMISLFGMNVIINHYFGTEVNAAMGIANQLSGVMMGVSMNMIKAVTPVIVKSEGGNQHDRMLEISYVCCKFSYLLFSFLCIPVLIFKDKVLSLWLVDVPKWANTFCLILIIATLIDQFTVVLYQSIMAGGDIRNFNVVRSCCNIAPLIVSIVMFQLSSLPPYWALVNWLVFYCVLGSIVNLFYSKSKLGLNIRRFMATIVLPCVFVSGVVIVCGLGLLFVCRGYGIAEICGLIATFICSVPLIWTIALQKEERNTLIACVLKIKPKCI